MSSVSPVKVDRATQRFVGRMRDDDSLTLMDVQLIDAKVNEIQSLRQELLATCSELETERKARHESDRREQEALTKIKSLSQPYLRVDRLALMTNQEVYNLTGCQSIGVLRKLYSLVDSVFCGRADNLFMYKAGRQSKGGRSGVTKLDAINQFYLCLFILRTGNSLSVATSLFGLGSRTTTMSYFVTWLQALALTFKVAFPFPNQADTQASMPPEWVDTFGNRRIRIVIDSTNINIPTASDPDVQSGTYSKYYSGNVAKILVGTSPAGAITFVSLPFPGKISDVDLTKELLYLDVLDVGDDVMGDKGFTIHHLTYLLGIGVIMPPKKQRGVSIFTADQSNTTSKIANKRIHVERAMKRIKAFKAIAKTVPADQLDILSHVVFVIAFLSNLQPPLKDRVFDDRDYASDLSSDSDDDVAEKASEQKI